MAESRSEREAHIKDLIGAVLMSQGIWLWFPL
jgi:hypothetical protein